MTFWTMLAALVLLALAFLLWPLRGRPGAKRLPAIGLVAALPAATLGLYLYLGAPAILDAQPMFDARRSHDVDAMLAALEDKLKKDPDDARGWYTLGRSYLAMQRSADAEAALARAVKLSPQDAQFLAHYAEALAIADGGNLQGRARPVIEQALEADFQEEKALELAGLAAFQRQEWAQAMVFWRRLLKKLPKDTEFHQDIEQAVATAERRAIEASGLGERAKLAAPEKKGNPH